jgi:hypothetical protein
VICDVMRATDPNQPNTSPERAFLWTDGKLTPILSPKEENPEVIASVAACALNNAGTVLVKVYRELTDHTDLGETDYRWDATRGMKELTVDDHSFMASSINNKGDILGVAGYSDEPLLPWTFGVMTAKNGFVPYFPIDYNNQLQPDVLNDNGEIVGVQNDAGGTWTPFRILPGATQLEPLLLPLPAGPEKTHGGVTAINKDGWTVGSVDLNPGQELSVQKAIAALWSPENTFYAIGAGYIALDINDQRQVVGCTRHTQVPPNHDSLAYVYDSVNGIRYLDSLVPTGSPHLTRADAINNKGEILCESASGWLLLKPVSGKS